MPLHPLDRLSFQSVTSLLLISPRAFLSYLAGSKKLTDDDKVDLANYSQWNGVSHIEPVRNDQAKVFLIASFLPLVYCIKLEGLIGRSMQRRGYRVVVLTNLASHPLVDAYHRQSNGFEIVLLEKFLTLKSLWGNGVRLRGLFASHGDSITRLKAFRYRGAYVGLHSLATLSISRNDGRVSYADGGEGKLRKILRRSCFLTDAAYSLVRQLKPSIIFGIEKGFVGTAEVFYAALEHGVDYVQWTGCHEPDSIMLKRYSWGNFRDHPFSIGSESWERILTLPWSDSYRKGVMAQLEAGYMDGAWFKYKNLSADHQQRERQSLLMHLGIDPNKKTAVIYSHILNDANLFYGVDLFEGGYEEWLVETVRAASTNQEVNWILKLHPANVFRNASSGYSGKYGELLALENAFGNVPEFLRIVYPEEKTSPLSFFKITDYGVTVRGTVGLELPCFGIPTLTAGTGRYAGKGFTVDSETRSDYLAKIRSIHMISPLSAEETELGQRYAYWFFRARPARYGDMFSDRYKFPAGHPRHRDIELGATPITAILDHPQMQRIVSFLCSSEEDFLDVS